MTSNKNNSNQQQDKQQQELNKYVDFIPGFAKRKEVFDKSPPLRTGRKFPYIEEPIEIAFKRYIAEIVNPKNKKFYPKTDEDNRPITMPDNINCKKVVLRIVRHRLANGDQVLTSHGQIIGHDVHGNKKVFTCDSPEKYTKTIFNTIKEYNASQKQIVSYCDGPTGSVEVYEMPFTPENVDLLYSQRYDGNPYFMPNTRGNLRFAFYIKDHSNGGLVKEIFWSSEKESLRLFKEMDFDSLWNSLYLPKAIREQMLMEHVGVVDNSGDKSNNNTSTRSVPSTSNTSAYK
jgi:hypothetical protein